MDRKIYWGLRDESEIPKIFYVEMVKTHKVVVVVQVEVVEVVDQVLKNPKDLENFPSLGDLLDKLKDFLPLFWA